MGFRDWEASVFSNGLVPERPLTMTYYLYRDVNQFWRWTLEAANNRKIANSGEGYHNKQDCIAAINLVAGSSGAPIRER